MTSSVERHKRYCMPVGQSSYVTLHREHLKNMT